MQTETFIFICGNFTHQAGRFDVCLSRDYVFFWKIWLSFSKMTPHWMNLLILRDIVWDNHTNLLIQFGVNQTKNMTTRGKWVIFLKYGWVFTTWPLPNEFADFERYSVRPPYKLTYKIWSKLDQKYGCQGQISDFFSEIWLSFSNRTPYQMNLLILRDIVWDHNTNSIMQFGVNQTKNMAARGKLLIFFLKYGWIFPKWPLTEWIWWFWEIYCGTNIQTHSYHLEWIGPKTWSPEPKPHLWGTFVPLKNKNKKKLLAISWPKDNF